MKNLKKILVALVLVALLVSSVVTIAIADASYNGDVETAQQLLDAVYAVEAESGKWADAKAPGLTSLYEYLITVNPQDEGYDAIRDAYNTMTFKVMYTYFEEYNANGAEDARAKALTKVHTYKTETPVIGNASDVNFAYGYVCENCGEYADFAEFQFFDGLAAKGLKCPGKCADGGKLAYTTDESKIVSYVEFEKEFNTTALSEVEQLVAYLFATKEMADNANYASYYDLKEASRAVEEFLKEVLEKEYKPATSALYTGTVADASAKLRGTSASSDFDKLKTSLASAYTYLVANPVNPTSDEFYPFITNYRALSAALVSSLEARVDACATPEAKFAELSAFREYLVATQISADVVNGYNEIREKLVAEYGNADEIINGLASVDRLAFVPVYEESLDEFAAKLAEAEQAFVAEEDISALVVELYGSYVSAFAYNPDADGYDALIERYEAICDAYVEDAFVAALAEKALVSEKLEVLVEFHGFVAENALSESVINKYNETRKALSAKLGGYVELVPDSKLPAYKAPAKEKSTASLAVLESFLEILTDSVDKYNVAEGDDKLAAFEDMKAAAAELRTYILGVNLDSEASYYDAFVAEYKAARDGVFASLVAIIDSAEGEAVIDALETVKAFLVEVPLTGASITEYNNKVEELVADADKAASLKLSSAYEEIDSLIAEIEATDDVSELRAFGVTLFTLSKNSFDVTDPAYESYLNDYASAMAKIADAIYADIVDTLNESDTESDAALVEEYLKYASSVYSEAVVTKTAAALKAVRVNFASVNDEITKTNANAAEIASVYESIEGIIDAFDSTTDLEARTEIFSELFDKIFDDCFNTAFIAGDSYAEIISEYERVFATLESQIIDFLNADVSAYKLANNVKFVYDFVEALPFSQNVIDEYNKVYASASSANFGQYVENIDTDCPAADPYKSPEGWNPNLARINIAIELSLDENGLVEDKFEVAYKILAGEIGVNGPQVIDFATAGFYDMITAFDNVKQNIVNNYNSRLDSAKDLDEKREVLDELGGFIDRYPFSKTLVKGYNDIRADLRSAYSQDTNTYFTRFQDLVNKVYEKIESCPIDMTYLTAYQKEVYRIGQDLIAAADYTILENYLEVALGISGPNALIYQNIAVDQLNASIGNIKFGAFNEKILAEANLKLAFIDFIEKFDKDLEGLSDDERAKKIASAGNFIVVNEFPYYLVSLYNAKYGTNLAASAAESVDTPANVFDYAEKLEAVKASADSAEARLAVIGLVEYVNSHKFSTEDTSGDMQKKLEGVKASLKASTDAQIEALDKLVNSDEASLAIEHNYDYSNGKCNFSSAYNTGDAKAQVVTDPVTGEKYAHLNANSAASLQYLLAINDASNGIVLDFDIMAEDALNFNIYFYGNKRTVSAITITDGVISELAKYPNYDASAGDITFTPGEWTHITIAFDVKNQTRELYIDYVSLGKMQVSMTPEDFQTSAGGRVKPYAGKAPVCIDNFKVYRGTAYRTLDKLDSATDDEKFAMYLKTLMNEEAKATERLAAYYSAQSIKVSVTDAALVKQLDDFYIDDIKAEAAEIHLAKVKELVDKVGVDSITTANTAAAQTAINNANTYIETNRLYIDQTSQEFRRCTQALIDAADKIVWLDNLKQYIAVVEKFHRATSYAALVKHLESVTYYYNLCELYDADKIASAAKDNVANAFDTKLKADADAVALLPDVSLANYYTDYIPARLAARMSYENAVKAVDCAAFIDALVENADQLTPDAYKAALLAAAEENFDYVDAYLTIIRKVVTGGEYDESYEGIDHALEVFEILNPMFFDAAQKAHFEHIDAQLKKYAATSSYIERAGICAYIRNYIADNDVDMSSDEGQKYMYSLQMYEEELVGYKAEYEAILAANTEAFIGMVKKMQAYVTYSELKPLYEEAIAKYYYSMNVDSKEAQEAVAIFVEYEKKIQAWEENSAMLIAYAKDLKANRYAQKYRALVRCSNYISGADEGVSAEAAAAIKLYATTLAEYMNKIEPAVNESNAAMNVVSALRTNRISANVLAMANTIINN